MKKLYVVKILFLLLFRTPILAQVLWSEDFETEANDATSGNAAGAMGGTWSVTTSPGGSFALRNNTFEIDNTDGEGVWSTNTIDISNYGYAVIDVYLAIVTLWGGSTSDYVQCFYSIDGGPEVLFGEMRATFFSFSGSTNGSAIVAGNTLRLIIRARDESTIGTVSFDNATITGVTRLYSRKNGDWNDGTTGNGTWSLDDFTVSPQSSCDCLPNANTVAIIGNGNTVNMNVDGASGGVEIVSTGLLRYTNDNTDLAITRGYLRVDGSTDRSDRNNARVNFTGNVISSAMINGSLRVDDLLVSTDATVNVTGTGSVTVNDDILFTTDDAILNNSLPFSFANMDCADRDIIVNNSGTFNQSGAFSNTGGSDFNNLAGATWNWSYESGGTQPPASLDCSAVNNTFNYNAAGDQAVRATTYHHLILSNSGNRSRTGTLDVNGDLTIQDNAVLTGTNNIDVDGNLTILNSGVLGGSGNLTLAGNWSATNTTSFTEGTRTVTFDGAADQTISNTSNLETFYNLTLGKASATTIVTMENDITVSQTLTLNSGRLSLNGKALHVSRNNTAAITGADANSYVLSETTTAPYGRVVWTTGNTNGTFVFPFGTAAGAYIPFTFNKTAGSAAGGTFSVATYPTGSDNTPYPSGVTHVSDASGADNSANVVNRFWILAPNGYPANQPTATLTFMVSTTENAAVATLRAQRWNTSANEWDAPSAGQTNPAPAAQSARVPNVTTYSPWTLSADLSPLPVELTEFVAILNNDVVDLRWTTATELNNDYFTVEHARNVEHFKPIKKVKGRGTTPEAHQYKTVDPYPAHGKNYYRLKQTDYNGRSSYSSIQLVNYEGPKFATLRTYPNPSSGKAVTLEIVGLKEKAEVPVEIINVHGQVVLRKTLAATTSGIFRADLTFEPPLDPGLYILKAGPTLSLTEKIVIE